jgi:hypothetical protein
MTVRYIFEISEDDHPSLVTHARDNWWILDFANAFVSPGVNSRGGLVPSHAASRRRFGDKERVINTDHYFLHEVNHKTGHFKLVYTLYMQIYVTVF